MTAQMACIFDWDGVVVDSDSLHVETWARMAEEMGRPRPNIVNIGKCGLKSQAVVTELLQWDVLPEEVERISLRKEGLFREIVAEQGIDSTPGVLDFLRALRAAGIPLAVGSSAPRLNVDAGMRALKLAGVFDAIVAGEDVIRGKPAPDIFLLAAERLKRPPGNCIVFEDAPAGVEAARAAGMKVIGVLSTHDAAEMSGADRRIPSFTGLRVREVEDWAAGHRTV